MSKLNNATNVHLNADAKEAYLGDNKIWPAGTGFCVETVQLPIRSNCAPILVTGENLTIENHLGLDWYIVDSRKYGRIVAQDPSFDIINEICIVKNPYFYIEWDFLLLELVDTTFPLFIFNIGATLLEDAGIVGYGSPLLWRIMRLGETEADFHTVLGGYNSDAMDTWGTMDLVSNQVMTFRLIIGSDASDPSSMSVILQHLQTDNQIWGNLNCNASMHGEYIAFGAHGYDPSISETDFGVFKFGIRNIRCGQQFIPST